MRHVLILMLLVCLLCGCGHRADDTPSETITARIANRITPSLPSTALPDPTEKIVDLCVGNDVISCRVSDMGAVVDPSGAIAIDQAVFDSFCQRLNELYGTPARDAQVFFTDDPSCPLSFVPEENGQRIDERSLAAALISGAENRISVDLTPIRAAVTAQDLKTRYTLLSEFTTSFNGSTLGRKNRVSNMALAVSRINGTIVPAGEEFSMNAAILDRTKENGYYLAPAIRNGTYEKEYGGGVCQVSSTLFNAVMMADLTVTERHHHSWPMTYVPIGRDATIATGYKDFRFINSTEGELLISAHMDKKAKTITVRLYGTHNTEFDHIRISSKRTGYLPAKGTKVMLDESLSAGSRVEERKERRGKTSVTYKEYYDTDGKLIRRETAYEDSYPSIEGLVYVSSNLYQ